MEENRMGLNEALRIIMDKVGNVRVPVREKETASALEEIANDLYECIIAVENAQKKPEEAEPEVSEDV